mgnify:CR=1 FL=1
MLSGSGAFCRAFSDDPRLTLHAGLYAWAAGRFEAGPVLDVGCEYGVGLALLNRANPGLQVFGCDLSREALHVMHVLVESPPPTFQARAEVLPVASASLAGVCLFNLLHLLPDPVPTLREARRVLRPGACIVLTLPTGTYLPPGWQGTPLQPRLKRAVQGVFDRIEFPQHIEPRLAGLPPVMELGAGAPLLAALCC